MRRTGSLLVAVGCTVLTALLLAGCAAGTVAGIGTAGSPMSLTTTPSPSGSTPPAGSTPPRTSTPQTASPTSQTAPTSATGSKSTVAPPAQDCPAGNRPDRPTAGDPVPTPSGAPVLTVTQGSNFWIANSSTEPLAIAVYADGTAIRAEGNGGYSDPLPGLTIGRIDACVLGSTIAELVELADTDLGQPGITDQGTTGVTLTTAATGGPAVEIAVYALGVGDDYVEPDQAAARSRLEAAIASLLGGLTDERAFAPESVRVSSLGEPLGDLTDRPAPLAWPLDTDLPTTSAGVADSAGCVELTGEQAAAVIGVLGSSPAATGWTDGQQSQVLAIGVLVPGQPGCPNR